MLRCCAAAGRPLAAVAWEHGRIAAMGWSAAHELLVLQGSGEVCSPKPYIAAAFILPQIAAAALWALE